MTMTMMTVVLVVVSYCLFLHSKASFPGRTEFIGKSEDLHLLLLKSASELLLLQATTELLERQTANESEWEMKERGEERRRK